MGNGHVCLCFAVAALWLVVAVGLVGCRRADAPSRTGHGGLAIRVDTTLPSPPYHAPLDRWRVAHGADLSSGSRSNYQCALCHDPEHHCISCHREMGLPSWPLPSPTTVTVAPLPMPSGVGQ